VNALSASLVPECLFGEADAEAIDVSPIWNWLLTAADAMGMDVEDHAEGAAATADGRNDSWY
jgi:hypothetical protein